MVRYVLIVVEILVGVGAVALGAYVLVRGRGALAGAGPAAGPGPAPGSGSSAGSGPAVSAGPLAGARLQVVIDMLLLDAITALMVIAAYLVYTENFWGRWVSLVAGIALLGGASARPRLAAPRTWVAPVLSGLGILVVVLALLLRSPG